MTQIFNQNVDKFVNKFDQQKKAANEYVSEVCERHLKERLSDYQRVMNSFEKFFSQEDLTKTIERKAEISLVTKLDEIKVNHSELQETVLLIQNLNDRVKHLATLQYEFSDALSLIRSTVGQFDPQDKQNILSKFDNLHQNSKIVSAWINEVQLDQHRSKISMEKVNKKQSAP